MAYRNPQVCATVTPEIYDQISAFAEKENRSISEAVGLLLQSAINEKKRNRNGRKDNNSKSNSSNERPGDARG